MVITTIQRLYSILKGEPEFDAALEEESAFDGHGAALVRGPQPVVYNAQIPPEFFDVIVVDTSRLSSALREAVGALPAFAAFAYF